MLINDETSPAKQKRHLFLPARLRRLGCWLGMAVWILLLLFPCAAIFLISQGEFAIQLGNLPEQRLRVWLVQDAKERGIGIANPSVVNTDEGVCLQTTTNFILWLGKGEPSTFCDCYTTGSDGWKFVNSKSGTCNP